MSLAVELTAGELEFAMAAKKVDLTDALAAASKDMSQVVYSDY